MIEGRKDWDWDYLQLDRVATTEDNFGKFWAPQPFPSARNLIHLLPGFLLEHSG
jgi:hypothetical protein